MMYYAEFMPKRLREKGVFEAIDWVMVELDLPENLHVSIEWKTFDDGTHGEVWEEGYFEEDDEIWFTIHLHRSLGKDNTIRAVFHEMVHIKQYTSGRLRHTPKTSYWVGKEIPPTTPYSQKPWEIEAYEQEVLLLKKFKKHIYEAH